MSWILSLGRLTLTPTPYKYSKEKTLNTPQILESIQLELSKTHLHFDIQVSNVLNKINYPTSIPLKKHNIECIKVFIFYF